MTFGNNIRDPARHDITFINTFIARYGERDGSGSTVRGVGRNGTGGVDRRDGNGNGGAGRPTKTGKDGGGGSGARDSASSTEGVRAVKATSRQQAGQ
eukprot:9183806-Pyramimonas_sp.AAC.1